MPGRGANGELVLRYLGLDPCVSWGSRAPPVEPRCLSASGEKAGLLRCPRLAEVYAALTRLPGKHRLSWEQVLLFLESIEELLTIVALDSREHHSTIKQAAAAGIVGGTPYDALLAQCALKADAEIIYTWNLDDFWRLGPEVAKRIRTP
jgi:predicted nucleic acid-binding protein